MILEARKNLDVIWLDLDNVYGSVPHQLMIQLAREMYLVAETIQLMLENHFDGFRIRFSTNFYNADWIRLEIEITMEYTISPILFFLAMEMILRAAEVEAIPADLGLMQSLRRRSTENKIKETIGSSMAESTGKQKEVAKLVCYSEHALWGPGPEDAESAKEWDECKKNPEHKNFIPVREFGIDHLAEEWQRAEFVELIKIWSDLTVRLRVSYTSPDRPEDGGSYSPLEGGQRVGTGYVRWIHPKTDPCSCFLCKHKPEQKDQVYWDVCIATAKHVVNDDTEVETLCADFYHDYDESRRDRIMKTLRGANVVKSTDARDRCEFTCVCHDKEHAMKMLEQLDRREKLGKELSKWLRYVKPRPQIIVSHPHGRSKYVTVGEFRDLERHKRLYSYTPDTCPGSSGACVLGRYEGRPGEVHHCQGGEDGLNKGFYNF